MHISIISSKLLWLADWPLACLSSFEVIIGNWLFGQDAVTLDVGVFYRHTRHFWLFCHRVLSILVEKMATKSIHHFTLQPLRLNLGIRKMNAKLHTRPQKRANWPLCKRKNIFCSKWYKIVVLIKILWGWLNFSACSIYCYITLKKKKNYY